MKIVYCIIGTYNSGGMERVLSNKANWLAAHGYEITIVTTDQKSRKPFFPLHKNIKCIDLGINYCDSIGKSFWYKVLHYPIRYRRHKCQLHQLLKTLKADIVVSMYDNEVRFVASAKDGSKKILEFHFSKYKNEAFVEKGWHAEVNKFLNCHENRLSEKFDAFVVLTEEDKEDWGSRPNMRVIPNACTFSADEGTAELTSPKVLAVGRYSEQKGFDRLIDIWSEACRKNTAWHLDIVGDGELRQVLQRQTEARGLSDRITLKRPTSKIKEEFLSASAVVMTSRYEGLPMALLEAQTLGLPVVSYACKCGPRDIITDGVDGFLVEEGDKDTFVKRLLELMENVNLRKEMGRKAKGSSIRFSEDAIMGKWTALFNSLVKQ